MDSDTQLLLKLHQLDQEIDRLKKLKEKIPQEIQSLKKEEENLIHRLEKIETELNRLQFLKREKELDIQTFEDRILKFRDALDKVRTNEEYKALLREKAQAEESIMEIEDEILVIMEDMENLEKEKKNLNQNIEKERKTIQKQIEEKEQKLQNVKEQLDQLVKEREKLKKGIKQSLVSRYEMIKKKRESAVAVVDSDTCTGCFLIIPPKVYSELVKGEKLLACPHCGRFLIYQPK
ncbi:MAG: C4-type zinc ribbon domain-containing protein [Persephonella sp.]|nr:C4-type zinc ribbon domain-containing protein [Persephonella sp.]